MLREGWIYSFLPEDTDGGDGRTPVVLYLKGEDKMVFMFSSGMNG
jgi:hypothetical protein